MLPNHECRAVVTLIFLPIISEKLHFWVGCVPQVLGCSRNNGWSHDWKNTAARVKTRYIRDGHSTLNKESLSWVYIHPFYWVDNHPLTRGTMGIRSLDSAQVRIFFAQEMTATSGDLAKNRLKIFKNANGLPTSANNISVQTALGGWATQKDPTVISTLLHNMWFVGTESRLTRWGIEAALWASKDSRTAPFP